MGCGLLIAIVKFHSNTHCRFTMGHQGGERLRCTSSMLEQSASELDSKYSGCGSVVEHLLSGIKHWVLRQLPNNEPNSQHEDSGLCARVRTLSGTTAHRELVSEEGQYQ